jgi:predicted membrane protein
MSQFCYELTNKGKIASLALVLALALSLARLKDKSYEVPPYKGTTQE